MLKVIEAVIAVTVIAELSICKTVTISERNQNRCINDQKPIKPGNNKT